MRFREFYYTNDDKDCVFKNVFEKYYEKGYFGSLDHKILIEQQRAWYNKFKKFIIERNRFELTTAMVNKESKITREYFTAITGIDVKYKTKEALVEIVTNYVDGDKDG